MRQLTLVRHAKSSWDDPGQDDFDRPLNKRGHRDAPEMGKRLRDRGCRPDLVLVSPALRARQTAELVLEPLSLGKDAVRFDAGIYDASCVALLQLVRSQPESVTHLMMIGHNPGFTELWNLLCREPVDNIPTCAAFSLVVADLGSWSGLKEGSGETSFVDYPKKDRKKK